MFSNLFGRNSKRNNKQGLVWQLERNHKTWRIRNSPININDEYILYSTDTNVGENGIVLYDIKNHKFDITKYPPHISPEYHSYCRHNDEIYMFNTDGSIIIFDMNQKTFKSISNIKNKQLIGRYSSCIHTRINRRDIIHIFGGLENENHLLYSVANNEYKIATNFGVKLENPSVIHLESQNKLIMFCGYAAKTFFIGSVINENEIKWEISKTLNIPNKLRDCGQMFYRNHIIIFGGCDTNKQYSNNIYLINVENGEITELNNIHCPAKDKYHVVFINNKIHLFGLWNNIKHYSLSIDAMNNILPQIINNNNNDNNDNYKEEKENIIIDEQEKENIIIDVQEKDDVNSLRAKMKIKDKIILDLKKENKELRLKLLEYEEKSMDERKYFEWNANMICLWIMQIDNGLFNEYKNKLLNNLIEDGIEGSDLFDINNHDQWKQFGIHKYCHRKILIQNIKKLLDNNNNGSNANNYQRYEGTANCTKYIDR